MGSLHPFTPPAASTLVPAAPPADPAATTCAPAHAAARIGVTTTVGRPAATQASMMRWVEQVRTAVVRHSGTLGLALVAIAVLAAGCSGALPDTLPARLADTGLYADFAARTIAPGVMEFEPQYPLWTDGAAKKRWIRLPPETAIDARDPDAWSFPIGTRLWKEFAFERRIETRFMLLAGDGKWRFATYAWSADGSDALLAPEKGVPAACETDGGKPFDIPARADCGACHAAGPNVVLGFSALQLSSDRDPLAPHSREPAEGAVDLEDLVERGLVRNLPEHLIAHPPRIETDSPIERAALGYLHGNCGMCHTSGGQLGALDLDLWTSLASPTDTHTGATDTGTRRTTLGRASKFRFANDAEPLRIAAGDPDASVLLRRMASRQPIAQMPPLGTHVPDRDALELIRTWIQHEKTTPDLTRSEIQRPR